MKKYASGLKLITLLLVGCGSGSGSGAAESFPQSEIDDFYFTSTHCGNFYEYCYCVPSTRMQEMNKVTIDSYGQFANAMSLGRTNWAGLQDNVIAYATGRKKHPSAEDVIAAFQWDDRLSEPVPDDLCVPGLDEYAEIGDPPSEYIVDVLEARGRAVNSRLASEEAMENITPPDERGLYRLTSDQTFVPLPLRGRGDAIDFYAPMAELPERFRELNQDLIGDVRFTCISIDPKDVLRVAAEDLAGFYYRQSDGHTLTFSLAVDDSSVVSRSKSKYDDYCSLVNLQFREFAEKGGDSFVAVGGQIQKGDILAFKAYKKSSSSLNVAVILVE